jgi:hypothetical protein
MWMVVVVVLELGTQGESMEEEEAAITAIW